MTLYRGIPGQSLERHTGSAGIIPDFTIVNYRWIINTLVTAKFLSSLCILSREGAGLRQNLTPNQSL
jgi:hypothetical protein